MMLEYFQNLVAGIESSLREDPESKSPRKVFVLEIARLGERLYAGNDPIAWCGVCAPFDLLNAMGITSCFFEFVGGMLASTGFEAMFLDESEQVGFGRDSCGYHRAVIGAARKNFMPIPDFLIGTSSPCTGGIAAVENLARHFKKGLFVLNVPQQADQTGVRYLADQLKDMTDFVTAHTGTSLDQDRLQAAIALSNQARDIMIEIYATAHQVPSPASAKEMGNFGIIIPLLLGMDTGVETAKVYRDEFKKRATNGYSAVSGERLRLLWLQNRIQFKNSLIEWLESEHQAAIVSDELNSIYWPAIDPEHPFESIARRIIAIPFNGPLQQRIAHLTQLACDAKVHGAINPCHWGCRQGTGVRGLIAGGLKAAGVPVLNLEVDCVDSRNFSEGQLKTRLEAFVEMLADHPSPWN